MIAFTKAEHDPNIIGSCGFLDATGACYLLDFVSDRPQAQHPFLLLGRYIDQYVKVNGEWRIAHSELDVVWPNE